MIACSFRSFYQTFPTEEQSVVSKVLQQQFVVFSPVTTLPNIFRWDMHRIFGSYHLSWDSSNHIFCIWICCSASCDHSRHIHSHSHRASSVMFMFLLGIGIGGGGRSSSSSAVLFIARVLCHTLQFAGRDCYRD